MVNDISIITTIIAIFLIVGTFLPFVHEAFGVPPSETSCFSQGIDILVSGLTNSTEQVGDKSGFVATVGSLTFFDVAFSIIGMFFWTCGALPLVIDLFFLILRISLFIIIARNLWIGGGG